MIVSLPSGTTIPASYCTSLDDEAETDYIPTLADVTRLIFDDEDGGTLKGAPLWCLKYYQTHWLSVVLPLLTEIINIHVAFFKQ